jgi:hypothetical protein
MILEMLETIENFEFLLETVEILFENQKLLKLLQKFRIFQKSCWKCW